MKIFYSLIEHNHLVSLQTQDQYVQLSGLQNHSTIVSLFLQTKISCYELLLTTKHFQTICILMNSIADKAIALFDGPGTRCTKIETKLLSNNKLYGLSSTFYVLLNFQCNHSERPIFLQYNSLKDQIDHVFNITSPQTVALPNGKTCFSNKICTLEFQTKQDSNFNITISSMKLFGEKSEKCRNSGVALYSFVSNEYSLASIECVRFVISRSFQGSCYKDTNNTFYYHLFNHNMYNYSHPQPRHVKSIYSRTNSALFIFFSFQEYANISLKATLTTISCEVISIDRCYFKNSRLRWISWNHCTIVQSTTDLDQHKNCYENLHYVALTMRHKRRYGTVMRVLIKGMISCELLSFEINPTVANWVGAAFHHKNCQVLLTIHRV